MKQHNIITMFVDFERLWTIVQRFSTMSSNTFQESNMFCDLAHRAEARVPFCYSSSEKKVSTKCKSASTDLYCSNTRFLGTTAYPTDPANPGKKEHGLQQSTHQHRSVGKDDVNLNKLLHIRNIWWPIMHVNISII